MFNIRIILTVAFCCVCVTAYRENEGIPGQCDPIPETLTSPPTGKKAWDKCLEYQKLVYPCEKDESGKWVRANRCTHSTEELIVGGTDANPNEFSHTVILGYGNDTHTKWMCSGALISDRFVLTAAHCSNGRELGPVAFVYIGALHGDEATNGSNKYNVKTIVNHPDYKAPNKYNDIALIELEKPVELNSFTVPACLYVGDQSKNDRATESSWWLRLYVMGLATGKMQKVVVSKYTNDECSEHLPITRIFRNGIDDTTQLCYGKRQHSDVCQIVRGSSLQIKNDKIYCMHTLIGVASFSRGCGYAGVPAIYTRVSHYVPWIESVVWP